MSQAMSDVSMSDDAAALTDSQLDREAASFLNSNQNDDRMQDALAIDAAQQPIHPAQPVQPTQQVQLADADATGVNDSSHGESTGEEDEETEYMVAIEEIVEESKKAGITCLRRAAEIFFDNKELLDKHGYTNISMCVVDEEKKINAHRVRKIVNECKGVYREERHAYELDAARGQSQEFNCDTQEEEDVNDGDYVEGTGDKPLTQMTSKELTELIAVKDASKDLLKEELIEGPVNIVFKESLDTAKADGKKEEGKASIKKVQSVMAQGEYKTMNTSELKLLSSVSMASTRKLELPGIIASLETEIDSAKEARRAVKLYEAEMKEAAEDAKKKDSKKRQLESLTSKSRKK